MVVSSCSKEAGDGGNSVITGKVLERRYNFFPGGNYTDHAAMDKDVYICYGDDDYTVDDRVRSSFDGTFKFSQLRKGKYRIFVYTEDTSLTSLGSDKAILLETEIRKNRSESDLGSILTFNL